MTTSNAVPTAAPSRTRYLVDLVERVLATAAEGAVGVVTVVLVDWPTWLAVPLAAGAAIVKGWLAKFSGSKSSASLVPRV